MALNILPRTAVVGFLAALIYFFPVTFLSEIRMKRHRRLFHDRYPRKTQKFALIVFFCLIPFGFWGSLLLEQNRRYIASAGTYVTTFGGLVLFVEELLGKINTTVSKSRSVYLNGSFREALTKPRLFYRRYLSFRTGQYGFAKFLFTEIFEFSIQTIFLFTTCNKRVSTDIIMSTTLLSLNLVSTPACLLANVRERGPPLARHFDRCRVSHFQLPGALCRRHSN